MAAFIVMYRRRSAKYSGFANDYKVAKSVEFGVSPLAPETNGLINPMFKDTDYSPPNLAKDRQSLKQVNVHTWLQEIKGKRVDRDGELDS